MSINAAPVRGTKDYLPNEVELRDATQAIILDTYKKHGFQRIATPVIEEISRLNSSEGGENLSLIFKILKRGQKLDLTGESLTENDLTDSGLRYDLTLPLSRYYANNRHNLLTPFKCIQIDKVFRAERPQKGRLREFFQCDIDIIGDAGVAAELELIHITSEALMNLGFEGFTVRINDRRILRDIIKYAGFADEEIMPVCIIFDKLDKIGIEGVEKELIEKEYGQAAVSKFIELISGSELSDLNAAAKYCSEPGVVENLKYVIENIAKISGGKFDIAYDKSLVRGMGYYTGMVFEVVSPHFSSSIAGGGRYDKMIGKFLGEDVPAVGFSIGFERICEILKEMNRHSLPTNKKLVLIYSDEDNIIDVLKKSNELIALGYYVALAPKAKKLGKQLDAFVENGFTHSFIFDSEIKELTKK